MFRITPNRLDTLRVLLLGCNGQLGIELTRALSPKAELIPLDVPFLNFEKPEEVVGIIRRTRPDVVFNAAAYTAVDAAESNPDLAFQLNATAPEAIAKELRNSGGLLVHYSTDYVFDGTKSCPYTEADTPAPLNVYGMSKLEGERAILRSGCRYLIFRISWLYAPHSKNFYRTICSIAKTKPVLRVVDDQCGAPTSAAAVAAASTAVLQTMLCLEDSNSEQGIFHMTGRGRVSWCGFARAIVHRLPWDSERPMPGIVGICSDEFPVAAKRPLNSVMDSSRLFRAFGVRLPPWRKQLADVIAADPSHHQVQAAMQPAG